MARALYHSDQMLICTHAHMACPQAGGDGSMAATLTPWRTRNRPPGTATVRTGAAQAVGHLRTVGSAARRRYRRPALHIAAFTSLDTAAWTTFGRGAGLLVLGTLLLVWEFLGADDETGQP